MSELGERLARIEGALVHIVKTVDLTAADVKDVPSRVSAVETRIAAIEARLPDVAKNSDVLHEQKGWRDAKEDATSDARATLALLLSAAAIAATLWLALWGGATQ